MIGERLKKLRHSKILMQKVFAEQLGITSPALSNYERGARELSCNMLIKIYKITNCNLVWLLTGEGEIYSTGTDQEMADELIKLRTENLKLKKILENQESLINILKNN